MLAVVPLIKTLCLLNRFELMYLFQIFSKVTKGLSGTKGNIKCIKMYGMFSPVAFKY